METGDHTCRSCNAPFAEDQRFCLNCGDRVAPSAVDWSGLAERVRPGAVVGSLPLAVAPGWGLLPATGRIAAALVLATVGTGVLLGGAASPVRSSAAPPGTIIAVAAPTPNPTPAPAAAGTPGDIASGAGLPDDVAPPAVATAGSSDSGPVSSAEQPAATAGAPAEPAIEPEPASEPAAEPEPESTATPEPEPPPVAIGPPAKHVVVVSMTGHTYKSAFGERSPATYLSRELPAEGVVLRGYRPVARGSLANQLALLAGVTPTPEQDEDCSPVGARCDVPARTPSIPALLSDGGRSWRAYVQNRGAPCGPPVVGAVFGLLRDPFPYLSGLKAECPTADVDLTRLGEDFASSDLAPSFAYVIPDFCHDGRDLNCPFEPGTSGLQRADAFLRVVVPAVTGSAAFADDGLLVILFDGGNLPPRAKDDKAPTVGAIVLGKFAAKGKVTARAYDHLSLLRTLAGTFGVEPPGRSGDAEVRELGREVFPSIPR